MAQKRKRYKRKSSRRNNRKRNIGRQRLVAVLCIIIITLLVGYIYRHEIRRKLAETTQVQQQTTEKKQPALSNEKKTEDNVQTTKTPELQKSEANKGHADVTTQDISRISSSMSLKDIPDLEYVVSCSGRSEQIIFHTAYTVSYNKEWKIPNWVSYELTASETLGQVKRETKFSPDPYIKEGTATDADYRRSGYDRGHMAPAADMKWDETAMHESFYLSNVCPQHPKLNQRRWKDLEDRVRAWAVADSAIVIICGPVVSVNPQKIGQNNVVVPQKFFKVILSPFSETPQAIGFIFDNTFCQEPLKAYVVSVDSVERLTGLDFFSSIPDDVEEVLESRVDTLYWRL